MTQRPLPNPTTFSKPFWDGAKEGKLLIQRCKACGTKIMYPKKYCPVCMSDDLEFVEACGKGKILTYTKTVNNAYSGMQELMPFTSAVVMLDEGVQLCTRIVDSEDEDIEVEAPVEVVFEKVNDDCTLVNFKVIK